MVSRPSEVSPKFQNEQLLIVKMLDLGAVNCFDKFLGHLPRILFNAYSIRLVVKRSATAPQIRRSPRQVICSRGLSSPTLST